MQQTTEIYLWIRFLQDIGLSFSDKMIYIIITTTITKTRTRMTIITTRTIINFNKTKS